MSIRYTAARIGRLVYRLAMSIEPPPIVRRVTSPSRFWPRIGHRFGIGHRAAFLLMFGLIFAAIGAGIVLAPQPPQPWLYHTHLPTVARVTLWVGCGLGAVAVSRTRWQWLGFAFLAFPPAERFLSYAIGTAADLFVSGPPLFGPYLTGVLVWLLLLTVIRLVASWPDPPADVS